MPYHILVGARNASRGEEAVKKLEITKKNTQSTISLIQIDIDSHESIAAAVEEVSTQYGRLDILVANAAIPSDLGSEGNKRAAWQRVFNTNVIGTVDSTHSFVPLLKKSSDPKLVVMSSSMGSIAMAEASPLHPMSSLASPYRATKAAINMILVEWNKSLQPIRVWGVDPGLCATDMAGAYSRENGRDPREGADIVRQCIEGEREEFVGKVIFDEFGETGPRPW